MKKNFRMAFLAAFVLTVGYSAYSSYRADAALSDLALDNVEALAGESWTGLQYLKGEHGTGGCIHCPELDSNCTC